MVVVVVVLTFGERVRAVIAVGEGLVLMSVESTAGEVDRVSVAVAVAVVAVAPDFESGVTAADATALGDTRICAEVRVSGMTNLRFASTEAVRVCSGFDVLCVGWR